MSYGSFGYGSIAYGGASVPVIVVRKRSGKRRVILTTHRRPVPLFTSPQRVVLVSRNKVAVL